MDLTESEILQLGQEINLAIDSVSDVDQILDDTNDDLRRTEELKIGADEAKRNAEEQLKHAEEVTQFLSETSEAQNRADASIQNAQEDIDEARKDLSQVIMSILFTYTQVRLSPLQHRRLSPLLDCQ